MKIFVESLTSLVFCVLGYGTVCMQLAGKGMKNAEPSTFVPGSRNRKLFLAAEFFSVVAVIITQTLFYPANGVIACLRSVAIIILLAAIAAVDLKTQIVPNRFLFAGVMLWLLFLLIDFMTAKGTLKTILRDELLASLIFGVFFLIVGLISRSGLGMGDVKLFFVIGLYLGCWGTVSSVFYSLLIAFLFSIYLLLTKRKEKHDVIPFVPFIFIGTLISVCVSGF